MVKVKKMKKILFFLLVFAAVKLVAQNHVYISPLAMKQDLAILKAVLVNLHPGIYKFSSKKAFEKEFTALALKADEQMPLTQFYLAVSQFINTIKCGHTFPNPLNLSDTAKKIYLSNQVIPFYFKIIDNKIIITHHVSDQLLIKDGDEILSINNHSSQNIIRKLLTVSRADGNRAQHKRLANISLLPDDSYSNTLFDIYFPLFFPESTKELSVEIRNSKGGKKVYKLPYMSIDQRSKSYESKYGKILSDENTLGYATLNASTAYLKFGTFAFWNSDFNWKNYIDSCFTAIQANKKINNLVIDLRGNEGGSGEMRDYLLSKITGKPLLNERNPINCYSYLTIPDSLLQYLSTWDRRFKLPKNKTEYVLNDIGLYQKKNQPPPLAIMPGTNAFSGNTYLLVDAVCSSATFGFAWTFQYNKLGTIIGEPTGGTKKGLNGQEMFFFTMPNAKIEIDIPLVYFYTKDVKDEGVIPDIIIKPTQQSIYNRTDPVLNYIQKQTTKNL